MFYLAPNFIIAIRILEVLVGGMPREDLQTALGLQDRKSFRERYLKLALTEGLIEISPTLSQRCFHINQINKKRCLSLKRS
jgi:hypothetical protein